jgi:hypothetical protein
MVTGIGLRGMIRDEVSNGLSFITSFFASIEPQPQYSWNNPINGNLEGMFRVYYQNIHGILRDDVMLDQDLQALADYDVGCFCLSETNLDWKKYYVKNDYLARQWKTWTYAKTSFLSIDMESSSEYMTGRLLTLAVGSWSSRVLDSEADPSGMG